MRAPDRCAGWAALAALCLVLGAPASASACRGVHAENGILHVAPPNVGPDQFMAEVEIVRSIPTDTPIPLLEARVLKLLQGQAPVSMVIIRPSYISSCDRFEWPGSRGILAGAVLKVSGDVVEVDPMRTPPRRALSY